MKLHLHFPRTLGILSAALLLSTAASARAGVLFNDWNYALDSTSDGSGGSSYEMLGLAYKQVGNQIIFAVSSNMPITGNYENDAANNHISPGDLFLNFSNHNLDSAADFNDPAVFAVRFSATNDSLGNTYYSTIFHHGYTNTTLGLFGDITPVSKSNANDGYSSLQSYVNSGFGRDSRAMGDLQSTTHDVIPYLGSGAMFTNISAGAKLSDIALLTSSQLITDGVDFAHFGNKYAGSEIYGFALNASLLPTGNFTAHLFEECTNDGIAINGSVFGTTNVPEPASIAIFAAAAGLLIAKKRKHV